MLQYKSNTSERVKDAVWNVLNRPSKLAGERYTTKARINGACIQVNGEWGCGKSLYEAFWAVERNSLEGVPIVTNLNLVGIYPYYKLTDNIEIIKRLSECGVIIDEIRRYMDSYLTQTKRTRFISNLVADLGKQSCDLVYADQSPTAAPTRVRNNISYIIYPKLDENTNWVTCYCFHGVEEYLWMQPFFYFGFYAPDYWWAYDTRQKIEDFKLRFDTKRYTIKYILWVRKNNYSISKKTMNLWNLDAGETLSGSEQSAILTFLEEKGYEVL